MKTTVPDEVVEVTPPPLVEVDGVASASGALSGIVSGGNSVYVKRFNMSENSIYSTAFVFSDPETSDILIARELQTGQDEPDVGVVKYDTTEKAHVLIGSLPDDESISRLVGKVTKLSKIQSVSAADISNVVMKELEAVVLDDICHNVYCLIESKATNLYQFKGVGEIIKC